MGRQKFIYTVYNLKHEQLFKGNSLEVVQAGYANTIATVRIHERHATPTRNGYYFKANRRE